MIPAREALTRLEEGNRRFVSGKLDRCSTVSPELRSAQIARQEPFAIILGCSDSRVPAEMVFDQGIGDLFVIRVAGNVIAPSLVGSVELAVEQFHTNLVVVMGHSHCSAVIATILQLELPREARSRNLQSIVDRVRPAVEPLFETELRHDPEALLATAVRANARASANQLRHGSQIIEEFIERGRVRVVAAHYSLETGMVEFFDGQDFD